MSPLVHAISSANKFGGSWEDYLKIHEKIDCSKAYFADNRHRALTHTLFWVREVMLPIFGSTIENSAGRIVSVKDICEQHILEDFNGNFIPNVQDWLTNMNMTSWMKNGIEGSPPSKESCK